MAEHEQPLLLSTRLSAKSLDYHTRAKLFELISSRLKSGESSTRQVICEVSNQYNIDEEGFRCQFKRMKRNGGRPNGHLMLSSEVELGLVAFLEACSLSNRPLSKSVFLGEVFRIVKPSQYWNRYQWLDGFLRRHAAYLLRCTAARAPSNGPRAARSRMFVVWSGSRAGGLSYSVNHSSFLQRYRHRTMESRIDPHQSRPQRRRGFFIAFSSRHGRPSSHLSRTNKPLDQRICCTACDPQKKPRC